MSRAMKQRLSVLGVLALGLAAASAGAVGTRSFELRKLEDFKGGDLQGVAVDSSGQVRAGFNLGQVPISEASSVWSAIPMTK